MLPRVGLISKLVRNCGSRQLFAGKQLFCAIQTGRILSTHGDGKFEFKAETRRLLDIVARSLYSDKEVFLRELISNASDSLEKQRLIETQRPGCGQLEIQIVPNLAERTLTIRDNGVGMTKEELIDCLGTIAHSGSKEFAAKLSSSSESDVKNIIGRFGVGFYSTFMVASAISVKSRSRDTPDQAWQWYCDGSSFYTLESLDPSNVDFGTSVTLHLKNESTDFLKESKISEIVKRYSNFIGFPISLSGKVLNDRKPIWLEDPKKVTSDDHKQFFRLLTKSEDDIRYTIHYKSEAPLSIKSILYIPKTSSPLSGLLRDNDATTVGLALYNRQVLITPHAKILPAWLNFVKGVVDCEDIPLNLSREILQDHQLISRLRLILTTRIIRHLTEEHRRNPAGYSDFYRDYALYLKEAIVRSTDDTDKHSIAQLLLFESSLVEGTTTMSQYVERMKPGQNYIFYISAQSRSLALSSPYFESFQQRNDECLLLCNMHDELVILQLRDFAGKRIRSIEQEIEPPSHQDDNILVGDSSALTNEESQSLKRWLLKEHHSVIKSARVNAKLKKHAVAITASQIGSLRQYLRSPLAKEQPGIDVYNAVPLNLEFNPRHDLIKKLHSLITSDEELAKQLSRQLIDNALVIAGISQDSISVVSRFNDLLCKLVNKKTLVSS